MSDKLRTTPADNYKTPVPTQEEIDEMINQAPEPVAWIPENVLAYLQEAGFCHAELSTVELPGRKPLYLAPPDAPFKAAVLDALTINWALKAEHETDARLAVADLIAAETRIALDPAVSSDARALIDKYGDGQDWIQRAMQAEAENDALRAENDDLLQRLVAAE